MTGGGFQWYQATGAKLDAEKERYFTSDVDDDDDSDNRKMPAAPRPESDAEYHSNEDGSLHDRGLEDLGVASVELDQPDNDSDASSISNRSYADVIKRDTHDALQAKYDRLKLESKCQSKANSKANSKSSWKSFPTQW